jgi:CTP synthase
VPDEAIALLPNAGSIYEVPITLEDAGIATVICKKLGLETEIEKPDFSEWEAMWLVPRTTRTTRVRVGMVAKYLDNLDTYMSVFEAIRAAAWANDVGVDIKWIDAETAALPRKTCALRSRMSRVL